MEEYEYLDTNIQGEENDVFRIALDNENLNAVNATMHKELTYVFKEAYRSDTRVVLLTGEGESFTSSADINWMPEYIEDVEVFMEIIREGEMILRDMVNLEKPIVAKVQGPCVALGTTMALFCDIVIASEDATFGDLHPQVGLASGDGGAVIWPLLTSLNKAKEFLMTGREISAAEAEELGLVNHVVPSDELDEKVDEIIDELASVPPYAVRYSKMIANTHLEFALTLAGRQGLALEGLTSRTASHHEAVDAFINGREPQFPNTRDSE